MHTGKTLLITTWLIVLIAVTTLGSMLEQKSQHFFGISDNREQAISFPHPVEIIEAHVVEGTEVTPGTLMLLLSRPDLKAELAMLNHQIAEIEARHRETAITLQGKINTLEQEKKVRTAALDTEIAELHKRHRLNLDVLRSISGNRADKSAEQSSPLAAKLTGLHTERHHVAEAADSQIDALRSRLAASEAPDQARLAELNAHRNELSRQQAKLTVTAKRHGRVGSVLFRPGDQVPAFAAIVTLHSLAPELIKGYIHEEVHNAVAQGQQVWVRSLTADHSELLTGTVESLGARIVPYPPRLLKNAAAPAWGREVVVRLDRDNHLLLGERTQISLDRPLPLQQRVATLLRRGFASIPETTTATSEAMAANASGGMLERVKAPSGSAQLEMPPLNTVADLKPVITTP
ncbi:MAG: hypothetical protein ABFS45_19095 [Pseudomonadota bacterium]